MKASSNFSLNWLFFWLLVFGLFAGGCTAGFPTGKWEVDQAAQQAFESGRVLPNHTYYYLGSYADPVTIMALDNQYTLHKNHVWAKVDDMSANVLNGWLSMYKTKGSSYFDYYGGVILTPDGKQAGIWYSPNTINYVEMPEPGVLTVFQPHSVAGTIYGNQEDGGMHISGMR